MTATTRSALTAAARDAALAIEEDAATNGTAYAAAQPFYGVEFEALVGEDWVRMGDLEDGAEVEAVRLMDCDGERGRECRTVAEVEAERSRWLGL